MKKLLCLVLFTLLVSPISKASDFALSVNFTIANVAADPYHRPYVAVWLETPKRKGVHTFLFWAEQEEWFRDLRQWWRKIGRKKTPNYDGVTGATRKPDTYAINWQGKLTDGGQLPAGDYILHFEAVREQGSREYFRQKITLGLGTKQSFQLSGKTEFGDIHIITE